MIARLENNNNSGDRSDQVVRKGINMSRQQAKAFIDRVNGDTTMQRQIRHIGDLTGLIGFAASAGFQFSAGDWNEAASGMALSASAELSNKELEQVAGGGIDPTPFRGWGSRFFSPRVTTINPCF